MLVHTDAFFYKNCKDNNNPLGRTLCFILLNVL